MTSKKENKKTLETFFEKEYHSLKAYVKSRIQVGSDRDPEDIIQDVALNLFAGAERYSPINNVAGFVYRSIKNRIIDVMRKGKPSSMEQDENDLKLIEFTELLYGSSDNPYSDEMMEELKQTILNLKAPFRDIIIAVDFEGYSYKEISAETGIPEGTLMSHRHRAIAQLHKELQQKMN
ncbi:MAG: RNA polymerase sigma factor (sigma-70 family) [Flavobacteriaceae bacterium]|jgi:RNA polymerase sigma factor (sigma-70 family)